MDGVEQEEPGVNELAAYIVSFVKNEVIEMMSDAGFDVEEFIDEAALLQIAKDEIEKALPAVAQAVIDRVQADLSRGLNS